MKITRDKVVSLHYTLSNDAGDTLDSSRKGEPFAYVHGGGGLLPGLEKALDGHAAGDKLAVRLVAKDAYGEHDPALIQSVPRKALATIGKIKVGTQFHAQAPGGARVMTITAVGPQNVTIDGNHPLAGQDLSFDVEVVAVRDASAEELAHGHVHGPGGHHH